MAETKPEVATAIPVPAVVTVGEFASALGLPVTRIIGELMKNGVMATINEQIDFETAAIIGSDLGFDIVPEQAPEEVMVRAEKLPEGEGENRPPIVAVMGHVDHGKTSLLDAIRSTSVAAREAGGITQHIGSYQIEKNGRLITFLDTPGHEAFSALRAHGARMTDVAIIVVAADDGVKPQTREAIKHAREAGVQIVVAINKVDKEGADPVRVRQELSELDLTPEEWGGSTVMVDVSAKAATNIDRLLELVLLVADLEDLRARPDGDADGIIVESHLDPGRGPVATVLVRNGQLKVGSYLVVGSTYAKVRSLTDWRGQRIPSASPGTPAVVTGLKSVPAFGDLFKAVKNEREAKTGAQTAVRQGQMRTLTNVKRIDAGAISEAITAASVKELNVVLKADVQGSLESLLEALGKLRNEEVAVRVVSSAVGEISETDVAFARTAGAMLIGFSVGMSPAVRQAASREGVEAHLYRVIYELLDDLRARLEAMLDPEVVETVVGRLQVLGIFKLSRGSIVCGGRVTEGRIEPKLNVRITRGGDSIGTGTLSSLQREKQPAKEVFEGDLCGLTVVTTAGIEMNDTLEFFTTESRSRTL